jgi:hypothetical protein
MYSGSTFNAHSGNFLGAHQKIDRVARRHLSLLPDVAGFPPIKTILQFEGNNGPDGIKRKSPAQNEPWHYIQPYDDNDTQLIQLIESHYTQLIKSLRMQDTVRAAFEAAWLAHAVVDGLTPAHHYPYEEKLTELRGGEGIETRNTIAKKLVLPGDTMSEAFKNNWKMWGPRGLFTTHAAFETGVATLIAPLAIRSARPTQDDIDNFIKQPVGVWFREQAQTVAAMHLYDTFYTSGWTTKLARQVRRDLAPILVRSVTLMWYGAVLEASKDSKKS